MQPLPPGFMPFCALGEIYGVISRFWWNDIPISCNLKSNNKKSFPPIGVAQGFGAALSVQQDRFLIGFLMPVLPARLGGEGRYPVFWG